MAQTKEGALKIAAKQAGLDLAEYLARRAAGLKRCTGCKEWRPVSMFNADKSRGDGLTAKGHCCTRVEVRKTTKGRPSVFKGRTHSAEAKAKISAANRGRRTRLGIEHTPDAIAKMRAAPRPRGEQHYNFQHGRLQRNLDARRTVEYFAWRDAVFKRDKYTCRKCGDDKGGSLRAHHILPFATHPELRYDVDNGLTLCHPCHELEHFKPDSIRNERKRRRGERLWK